MIYIIDSHAWIEYLIGSAQGSLVKRILSQKSAKCITLECCISELKGFCIREKYNFSRVYKVVKGKSYILPVLIDQWIKAADIKAELRVKKPTFGLIDAILIAKQMEVSAKIVTGDPHFKGLKKVVFIGT